MEATSDKAGGGKGNPRESLTARFGDAIQASHHLVPSGTRFDGLSDLQIGKLAADTLAVRLRQDEEYHQTAANLSGSGSIAGVRDLGVPNNLAELQQKLREKDELFFEWLQLLLERQLRDLSTLADDLTELADKFEALAKKLQAAQDRAFTQLDALEEELEQFERTGSLDEFRLKAISRDRKSTIPADADREVLYFWATQEVSQLRHETEERQAAIEMCDRECRTLRGEANEVRETIDEVQSRNDQGIFAEEDAETLEAEQAATRQRMEAARQRFEQIGRHEEDNYEASAEAVDQVNEHASPPAAEIPTNFDL